MIAFDNGPADGDYVRYIEAMAKAAATNAAAQAGSTSMASSASSTTGFDDKTMQARARPAATRLTTTTPAAAAAVAKAMALQAVAGRTTVLPALGRALASLLLGVLLVVVGVSMRPTSVLVVLAGIALFVVGFRLASSATAAMRERSGNRAS